MTVEYDPYPAALTVRSALWKPSTTRSGAAFTVTLWKSFQVPPAPPVNVSVAREVPEPLVIEPPVNVICPFAFVSVTVAPPPPGSAERRILIVSVFGELDPSATEVVPFDSSTTTAGRSAERIRTRTLGAWTAEQRLSSN